MGDIIDDEEIDKDTVELEALNQLFSQKYNLIAEHPVTPKSYINKLDGTKSLKLVAGLSDNSIQVYELNNTSISKVCRLSGHQKGLTEVVFSPKEDHLIYSAGLDGVLKLWDTRQSGKCAQEFKDDDEELIKPYECMDVSRNGRVLCAGSQLVQDDAYLVFWDQRMPEPLGGFWNSHTDDITQVKFHKEKTEIIATGSLDGLLNIFNVMEQNEDDALTYSLNVENSVERLRWLDARRVACLSQSNDLQLWDADSGDMISSFGRDKIARKMKRSKGDDCYLVDAFNTADDATVLLAGSYGGDGDMLRSLTVADKKLQPRTNFAGNKQTVRCCWYDKHKDLLVTCGEGGAMSAWAASAAPPNGCALKLARSVNKLHVHRRKPY